MSFACLWPGTRNALTEGEVRVIGKAEGKHMLMAVFIVSLVLWALGMVSATSMGGFLHVLLFLAVAVVLIRVIQGRRVV